MPIIIDETYRCREGTERDSLEAELRYVIEGTDDDSVIRSRLKTTSLTLTVVSV